jgi:hypothetical protein
MALLDYSPASDDARPVLVWWGCLSSIAVFNVAVLLRSARSSHASNRHRLPPRLRSMRDGQLSACSAYVLGCAYRSVLPCHHTLRRALVRSPASTGFVGRAVATVAELSAAAQASLLLREIGCATGGGGAAYSAASRSIMPAIAIAQACSWWACTTSNYAGSVVEEGLWAACALVVATCLAGRAGEYEAGGEQRAFVRRAVRGRRGGRVGEDRVPPFFCRALRGPARRRRIARRRPFRDGGPHVSDGSSTRAPRTSEVFLIPRAMYIFFHLFSLPPVASSKYDDAQLILSVAYFAYMVSVDVPNYVRSHLADRARGASYRSPREGLVSLLNIDEHDLTWSYDDWRYPMVWMTLYFSVACWASIGVLNAPRMDEGLAARRSRSSRRRRENKQRRVEELSQRMDEGFVARGSRSSRLVEKSNVE